MIGGTAGSGLDRWIVSMLPPHRVYVEPFLGAGAVAGLKTPAPITIVGDMDCARVSAWRARADRPAGEIAICGDGIRLLRSIEWEGDEVVYCDPPYLFETRADSKRKYYTHEFGEVDQHEELLDILTTIPTRVVLSGYWSEQYANRLTGWRVESRPATTRGARVAIEYVWMNFPQPEQLHDPRFVGGGFREREVVKRRRDRWARRFLRMSVSDRSSILLVLLQCARGAGPVSHDLALAAELALLGDGGSERRRARIRSRLHSAGLAIAGERRQ